MFIVMLHSRNAYQIISNVTVVQPFAYGDISENIKARVTGPLWGESTVGRWIPLTKGQ